MNKIAGLKSEKKTFNYSGKGGEFFLMFFKNIFLTIITLGLYYPWAKIEILKYHYQSSELDNTRFSFNGTGKEVFKGYIKVYLLFIAFSILYTIGVESQNAAIVFISIISYYLIIFLLIPFAIHGSMRYRASRSSWKGITFKYLGDRVELLWKFIIGLLLTLLTLGIYGSWFQVEIRKYVISHLRFGNLSFDFKGKGENLFWIHVKGFFLSILTFGIYSFWYTKNLWAFYADNTEITQNGRKIPFKLNARVGDVFELVIINFFLVFLTFGIAYPLVIIRTFSFVFRFLEIEEGFDFDEIQQVSYDQYDDTTGESVSDFLDFDLI